MKMESVEFYAQLLYQSKVLGGPKEFDEKNIEKLYEIRRKFGMAGKHPANLCLNKAERIGIPHHYRRRIQKNLLASGLYVGIRRRWS